MAIRAFEQDRYFDQEALDDTAAEMLAAYLEQGEQGAQSVLRAALDYYCTYGRENGSHEFVASVMALYRAAQEELTVRPASVGAAALAGIAA